MKIIKNSKEFLKDVADKFLEYLNSVKDGDKIKFEYDTSSYVKDKPIVKFTPEAYFKMRTLIQKATGEIGWNGTVERDNNIFTITDILVYPQTVTGCTVTCDEIETGLWLNKFPTETFNKIRFQGHSHVNMGTAPSGTDRTMYDKYTETIDDDDYYIFMILNKKDEFYIEIVDKKNNAVFYKNDITVEIIGAEDFWKTAQENIKVVTPPAVQNKPNVKPSEDKAKIIYNVEFENCKKDCSKCDKINDCMDYYMDKEIV